MVIDNFRPMNDTKTGLAPIIDADAEVLILGSLPSDTSIRRQEYYGNRQNRFWTILSIIFGEQLAPEDYAAKIRFLHAHHIALWDILHCAKRPGSADAAITDEVPNDIATLLRQYPQIHTVAFNGQKAEKSFAQHVGSVDIGRPIRFVSLRSSSPANAQYSLAQMVENWMQISNQRQ